MILHYLPNLTKQINKVSNVLEHKGVLNDELLKWADKYYVYYLDKNYNNASYQRKNKDKKTSEVLITNYEVER